MSVVARQMATRKNRRKPRGALDSKMSEKKRFYLNNKRENSYTGCPYSQTIPVMNWILYTTP